MRADERRVVEVAAGDDLVGIGDMDLAVELAEHAVLLLAGLQQAGAVVIERRIDRERGVENEAAGDQVEQPPGLEGDRAAGRPGLVPGRAASTRS